MVGVGDFQHLLAVLLYDLVRTGGVVGEHLGLFGVKGNGVQCAAVGGHEERLVEFTLHNLGLAQEAALDDFTLMKILSRIEGDKRSIGDKLEELQEVITESNYPKSNKKLRQMAVTLRDKQFVSYWT